MIPDITPENLHQTLMDIAHQYFCEYGTRIDSINIDWHHTRPSSIDIHTMAFKQPLPVFKPDNG